MAKVRITLVIDVPSIRPGHADGRTLQSIADLVRQLVAQGLARYGYRLREIDADEVS